MTRFPSLFRGAPLAGLVDRLRIRPTPLKVSATGGRELAARSLLSRAQILRVCGYAFVFALLCSAVLGSRP